VVGLVLVVVVVVVMMMMMMMMMIVTMLFQAAAASLADIKNKGESAAAISSRCDLISQQLRQVLTPTPPPPLTQPQNETSNPLILSRQVEQQLLQQRSLQAIELSLAHADAARADAGATHATKP